MSEEPSEDLETAAAGAPAGASPEAEAGAGAEAGRARMTARLVEDQVRALVVGQAEALQGILVALVAGGHVLLEGVPGVAKTLLAKAVARAFDATFARVQFTPDLMPSDITGVNIYDSEAARFHFRKGPVFAHIVLADEINRAPAKTQAALLEAMQERQVSLDGETHFLPDTFMVIGTQNPVEHDGTYPLPDAQLDRFLMKVVMDYPAEGEEREILGQRARGGAPLRPEDAIAAVATPGDVLAARRVAEAVVVDDAVLDYVLALVRRSRALASLSLGASPRAGTMLLDCAKGLAALRGRAYLTPDDVQAVVPPVLRHRLRLTPEAEIEGLTPDSCIQTLIEQTPVPR